MKKIFSLIIVGFCLAGCLQAGDMNLCDGCYTSVEKRDYSIQKMEQKYPINEQLLDAMNNNERYIVKAHTRKYDGFLFGSEDMLANILLLPIALPLSMLHTIGFPVAYDYGMTLENQEGVTVFVSYSSLLQEYPNSGVEKKYDLMTPSEYIKNQEAKKLQQQEQQKRIALQKEIEARQKQEQLKQKEQAEKQRKAEREQLSKDIADCEQAVAKAIEKRKSISADDIKVFDSNFLIPGKDGLLYFPIGDVNVVDFASNGVFVSGHRYFIYTKDTDYATNEEFRGEGLIYEKVGNYKYTTITGATRSVPAYKATSHKISEINPKTYLKNKNLSCCQYQHYNSTEGDEFKEVGVEVKSHCSDADSVSKSPHYAPLLWCTNGNASGRTCFTNNHPKGAGFSSSALCTGINYKE